MSIRTSRPGANEGFITPTGEDTIQNKKYQGGTAADLDKFVLSRDTKANLDALTREEGSIYWATDLAKFFIDDGAQLVEIAGTGVGELNYIENSSFSNSTDGWTDNSGGMTVTRTTTSSELPREFLTETGGKIVASTATVGDYVAFDFDLDDSDKSRKLKIQWDQKPVSGYTTGDFEVIIRDLDNAVDITPNVTSIDERTSTFISTFDTPQGQNLELRIRTTVTDSAGLVISNVIVGPGKVASGGITSKYEELDISGSGDFDSGQSGSPVRLQKVDNLVVMTVDDVAHTSGSSASTAAGFIPSEYRYVDEVRTVFDHNGSNTREVRVQADGTITFSYIDWTGSPTAQTTTGKGATLSWAIDEPSGASSRTNQLQQDNLTNWLPIPDSSVSNISTSVQAEGGHYRQVGDSMEVRAVVEWSGTDQTTGSVQPIVPNSESIDTDKIFSGFNTSTYDRVALGSWQLADSSENNHYSGTVIYDVGDGTIQLALADGSASSVNPSLDRPIVFAAGDTISWQFTVPIQGWGGDQSSLVGFSEATSDNLGLVKASSGTYVPSATNDTNVDSSDTSGLEAIYMHLGDVVQVVGRINVDATSADTTTIVDIDLPIDPDSTFSDSEDASGVINSSGNGYGRVNINASTNKVRLNFVPTTADNTQYRFSFMYKLR